MGEIINLRMARKRAERARRETDAAEARVRHGRTGIEKRRDRIEAERAERFVAGHEIVAPREPA